MSDQSHLRRLGTTTTLAIPMNRDIRKELVRKSLHLLIGCTPTLSAVMGTTSTLILLGLGVVVYSFAEYSRLQGRRITIISRLTEIAMRERDKDRFVLGPVTLGIGAMLALLLYPEPAASVAIYALAFGDGLSSVAGKLFGTVKLPFTGGKSAEGSLTCFVAVFMSVSLLIPGIPLREVLVISFAATLLEVLPSKDFDNLILPVGTGLVAILL